MAASQTPASNIKILGINGQKIDVPHVDELILKYGPRIAAEVHNIDAKELKWGNDKTLYKLDKLGVSSRSRVFSNPRLKYYKVYYNDKLHANFCIDQMDPTARKLGAVYIGLDEYLRLRYGSQFHQDLKSEVKDYRAAKDREELRIIRDVKEIETKLLK